MTINPGTIVTPQGDPNESIIGIVVSVEQDGYPLVAWVSASRGAFLCNEAEGDLDIAPLDQREGINDHPIDHAALAAAVSTLTDVTECPECASPNYIPGTHSMPGDDVEEDEPLYDIVRFFQANDKGSETIEEGLTLAEAQAHCAQDDTHGDGWFDGYRAQ